jgi:metal-responsive CopG/Arc/MetJ family transcriptional regulator
MTVKQKSEEHGKKTVPRQYRKGKPFQLYVEDNFMDSIDEWIKAQPGQAMSRSEAIRRLTAAALEAEAAKKKGGKK